MWLHYTWGNKYAGEYSCSHTYLQRVLYHVRDTLISGCPGADFDPRERSFDMEELRPQPIIRKRPKVFVAPEQKDEKYWDTRAKNTVAARR